MKNRTVHEKVNDEESVDALLTGTDGNVTAKGERTGPVENGHEVSGTSFFDKYLP